MPVLQKLDALPFGNIFPVTRRHNRQEFNFFYIYLSFRASQVYNIYEGWNFNGGNYLFTTDTK